MAMAPSPLRYPGGKFGIRNMISTIINQQELDRGHYIEPYAGGAGLALSLLFGGHVHEIHLNDLDRSIWSFWYSILNQPERFISAIRDVEVTLDEWKTQREVQTNKESADVFDLGFSTFFLNRTNRSGIIQKAGVIGGLKQNGAYKLDCRFGKTGLIERIERIRKYSHRINLYNEDAIDFIQKSERELPENKVFCIDPPYYHKGATLYTNFYEHSDHFKISEVINRLTSSWLLTYDNCKEISHLYEQFNQFTFNLNYTAAEKRVGKELLITNMEINDISESCSLSPA
ncbi:DNA adenine methylase [Idiomarina aminovorans]|uniref:DNA adenine methylase n=1 Tax=Idiomarina aminovorans TaxID=2914829 RepID=UPI002006B789|nr:DNA adenine methylase [Idiomarina sp. ATCH4]MCK7459948.1 DNA adenine methylase [Idiomarina sp. ATCH4]